MTRSFVNYRQYLAYGFTCLGCILFIWWHFEGHPLSVWKYLVPGLFNSNDSLSHVDRILTTAFVAMNATLPTAPFIIPILRKSRLAQWFVAALTLLAGLIFSYHCLSRSGYPGHLPLLAFAPLSTTLGILLIKPVERADIPEN